MNGYREQVPAARPLLYFYPVCRSASPVSADYQSLVIHFPVLRNWNSESTGATTGRAFLYLGHWLRVARLLSHIRRRVIRCGQKQTFGLPCNYAFLSFVYSRLVPDTDRWARYYCIGIPVPIADLFYAKISLQRRPEKLVTGRTGRSLIDSLAAAFRACPNRQNIVVLRNGLLDIFPSFMASPVMPVCRSSSDEDNDQRSIFAMHLER